MRQGGWEGRQAGRQYDRAQESSPERRKRYVCSTAAVSRPAPKAPERSIIRARNPSALAILAYLPPLAAPITIPFTVPNRSSTSTPKLRPQTTGPLPAL